MLSGYKLGSRWRAQKYIRPVLILGPLLYWKILAGPDLLLSSISAFQP